MSFHTVRWGIFSKKSKKHLCLPSNKVYNNTKSIVDFIFRFKGALT